MKKLLALVALVAMVAVSSIAYAQADDVTISATLGAAYTVTGCPLTINNTSYLVEGTGDCDVTYTSSDSTGYDLGASGEAIPVLTNVAQTIVTLDTGDSTCVEGAECWSWSADTLSDADADFTIDSDNGADSFGGGQHTVNATVPELFATQVVGQIVDATFSMNAYLDVATDTDTATEYTGLITVTAAAAGSL